VKDIDIRINSSTFSDDNRFLVCGCSEAILIFVVNNNFQIIKKIEEEIRWFNSYFGTIVSVAFSNNCKYLVAGLDINIVWIKDVNNDFDKIHTFEGHYNYQVKSVANSNDNKYLVSGCTNKTISIYDVNDNFNKIRKIQDHIKSISALTFSYDSKYLVTAGSDKSMLIYDINNNFNILYCKNNTSNSLKTDSINSICTMTSKYFKNFKWKNSKK